MGPVRGERQNRLFTGLALVTAHEPNRIFKGRNCKATEPVLSNHVRKARIRNTVVAMKKRILIIQPLHDKALELLQKRKDVTYEVLTDLK